jgi:hypothetical protein
MKRYLQEFLDTNPGETIQQTYARFLLSWKGMTKYAFDEVARDIIEKSNYTDFSYMHKEINKKSLKFETQYNLSETTILSYIRRNNLPYNKTEKIGDYYMKPRFLNRPVTYQDLINDILPEFVFTRLPFKDEDVKEFVMVGCWRKDYTHTKLPSISHIIKDIKKYQTIEIVTLPFKLLNGTLVDETKIQRVFEECEFEEDNIFHVITIGEEVFCRPGVDNFWKEGNSTECAMDGKQSRLNWNEVDSAIFFPDPNTFN